MNDFIVTAEDLERIQKIIDKLNARTKLTEKERDKRYGAYISMAFDKILSTGASYGKVTGAPGTIIKYASDGDSFEQKIKDTKDNLAIQFDIVSEGIEHYFKIGEYPAPFYAWRIAIILRKANLMKLEYDFLDAYNQKFNDGIGKRYQQLVERQAKCKALLIKQGQIF